jgi:uncharacterized protein YuzE
VKQAFDLAVGALYLTLADGDVARTVEIDSDTNVDLDADGQLLGIEVLEPGQTWPLMTILLRYGIVGQDAEELLRGYPFPSPTTISP